MIEERRFFLRVGVFAALVTVVYWFLSYEVAGSVMLLGLALAAGSLTLVLARTGGGDERPRSPVKLAIALATFEEREENPVALKFDETPLAHATLVPLATATGAGAITVGLVFGAWLWLPGLALASGAGARWLWGRADPR